MRRFSATSALALPLLLLALAGCGGGGEETTSATGPSESAASQQTLLEKAEARIKGKAQAEEAEGEKQNPVEPAPAAPPRHVPVAKPQPGSKAPAPGVPTTKGGDNSIQAFGAEGEEEPRAQAVSNLLAYLQARLSGEWERACDLASEEFREQLEALIERAKAKGDAPKPKGCAETLALLTPGEAKAELRKRFVVEEVLSFRVEEPYAYLIFKGDEGEAMFIAMNDADGSWRVNVLEPGGFGGITGS
jgi:hypothetical protein